MRYKLISLPKLSENEASLYPVYLEDENTTLLDRFFNENINSFKSELIEISLRLKIIGHDTGAREQYFKTKEGRPGRSGLRIIR